MNIKEEFPDEEILIIRLSLAKRMQELREELGLSYIELSKLTGIRAGTLADIQRVSSKVKPTLDTVVKIAKALHVRPVSLLDNVIHHSVRDLVVEDLRDRAPIISKRPDIGEVHNKSVVRPASKASSEVTAGLFRKLCFYDGQTKQQYREARIRGLQWLSKKIGVDITHMTLGYYHKHQQRPDKYPDEETRVKIIEACRAATTKDIQWIRGRS